MIYGMVAVCTEKTYLKFKRLNQKSFVIDLVGSVQQKVPGYSGFN